MRTFAAFDKKDSFVGSISRCLEWANQKVARHHTKVIHIASIRPGYKHDGGVIVAEISGDGVRWLAGPSQANRHRTTSKQIRLLRKGCRNGSQQG